MMSKSSPICISDDSEDEKDESSNNYDVVEVSSNDENKMPRSHLSPSSTPVKIKTEPEIPTETSVKLSPNPKIMLNKKRLKWLSGIIKLPGVPVKTESDPSDQDYLGESSSACASKTVKKTSKINDQEDSLPQTLSSSSTTDESEEDQKDHEQAPQHEEKKRLPSSPSPSPCLPLPSKHFPESHFKSPNKPKNSKSNLQKAIQSPRKVGVFGSPQKSLKQSLISEESFSPKKLMENPSDKIEDTSDHTQPLHACPINGYVPRLKTTALTFSESQLNVLEAIKEEGLVAKYIDTIMSFLSKDRKPPSQLCYDLMREVLLKSENSYLVSKSFWALKRIQALHPSVPEQIGKNLLTWDLIEMIVERMELFGCKCKKLEDLHEQPCVKSVGAAKTLTFVINVMESEVPRKQFCLRRTMAFRLLSLQRQSSRNVNQVVWWLRECIATLCCKSEDCSADYKLFDTISSVEASTHSKKKQLFYALGLFQRLIQLSLSVSEDPEKCAGKLAGELLFTYNQIECLEGRSILLQSFHSHLLRSKFLELYLEVYCKDTEADRNIAEYSGIQRIIQVDFERLPQKRDVTENNSESRICHGWHRSQHDCEEMSMVLSYSLQSYLFCHHKKLQCSPKRVPSTSHSGKEEEEEEESDQERCSNRRHLSVNDVDQLCNMGDHVIILAGRLMSLCHEASLNKRTNQLLNLLSEMKLWEPW